MYNNESDLLPERGQPALGASPVALIKACLFHTKFTLKDQNLT